VPIQVRDNRGGNWFWLHNAVVDMHGAQLGPYAGWIYVALCRHSNMEQTAWVSHRKMAEETGISDRKLRDELKRLEVLGLITIEQRLDDRGQQTNVYTLLDPLVGPATPLARGATPLAQQASPPGIGDQPPRHDTPTMNKTQLTRLTEQEEAAPTNLFSPARVSTNGGAGAGDSVLFKVWQSVLADLQEQMVPTNFTRWLARTSLLGQEAGTAVVGVPDQVSADQLAKRFDPLVRRALADACGEAVAVRYEVVAGE
jgi:hypothetical protein